MATVPRPRSRHVSHRHLDPAAPSRRVLRPHVPPVVVVVAVLRGRPGPHGVLPVRSAGRGADRHRHRGGSGRLPGPGRPDDPLAGRLDVVAGRRGHAARRPGRRRGRQRGDLGRTGTRSGRDGLVAARAQRGGAVRQPARRSAGGGARLAGLRAPAAPGAALTAGVRPRPGRLRGPVAPAAGGDRPARRGRPPDHLRDHAGLRVAVQPHRRQRPDDAGVPHRPGRALRRARVHRCGRRAHGLADRRALVRPRPRCDRSRPRGVAGRPGGLDGGGPSWQPAAR